MKFAWQLVRELVLACLASVLSTQAATVFNDTFEPNGALPATRNDDSGPGFGLDIQWRPRVSNQAGSYSVVNDAILGHALQFSNSANYLFIIGQFDGDAADGVSLGGGACATLGANAGDQLRFSMDLRTTTLLPTGYNPTAIGFCLDPNGPVDTDPSTNSWVNDCRGYFVQINNGSAGLVPVFKEAGTNGSPTVGSDVVQLTGGITGMTAGLGLDTNKHNFTLLFTQGGASVRVEVYWDGAEVSTVVDSTAPYTSFNTFLMEYGPSAAYLFDNVKLEAIPVRPLLLASRSSNKLVLTCTNGTPGATNWLLCSTNVALPLSNWASVVTNVFDSNGRFSLTNTLNPAVARQFFALQLPAAGEGTNPASTNDTLWIPACGAWLGGICSRDGMSWTQANTDHETRIGRQLDIVRNYHPAGTWTALSADELAYINAGRKLLLNFKPALPWHDAVGAANGGSATVDSQMAALAQSIAGIRPKRVMLTIHGEPERYVTGGGGSPGNAGTTADYVGMWHNVRSIFDAHGANNVIWCWDIQDYSPLRYLLPALWPGNSYIDWVMWDPYQSSASQVFVNDLQDDYNWLVNNSDSTHNYASKPFGLAEWGVGLNSYVPTATVQANTFNALNTALNTDQFPNLKLLAYYDEGASTLLPGALTAYSSLANSLYLTQQCNP